jgi:hypothetical protein
LHRGRRLAGVVLPCQFLILQPQARQCRGCNSRIISLPERSSNSPPRRSLPWAAGPCGDGVAPIFSANPAATHRLTGRLLA